MAELDCYDYDLPRDLIAQRPLPSRHDARLMVVDRVEGSIDHAHVRDLPNLLNRGDCLVLNDSKVLPARLVGFRTATGGKWQGLYLKSDCDGVWQVLSRTRGRLQVGEWITLCDRQWQACTQIRMVASLGEGVWAVRPKSDEPVLAILDRLGRVPLPPYIRDGEMIDSDWNNYQTVFAQVPGSVAAPTAGLHFTPQLLERLSSRGITNFRLTLHVGPGTFRPVSTSVEEHQMPFEWGELDVPTVAALKQVRQSGHRVIAVGTTSVRVLETASRAGDLRPWSGETNLFIRPPYRFRAIDGLLTNFHLPRSTLLILVRTFGGDELICRAYNEAIEQRYRFYSYGDAMLIL